jgi:hypothetical protein
LLASWLTNASGLQAVAKPPGKAQEATVADRLTLRDGVVRGLVTSAVAGSKGGVEMLVRRDWAEAHLPSKFKAWDRAAQAAAKPALAQRRVRLKAWRQERAANTPQNDPIVAWIDRELDRIGDAKAGAVAPLMVVRVPRSDVRELVRQPKANGRLLALGWLNGHKDVETTPADDVKLALEGRGLDLEGDEIPPLDSMLPVASEPEAHWLARRAATELAVDPDLRFIRYQGLLLPDSQLDQAPALGGLDAASALGEIAKLLDPNAAEADPLPPALEKIGARGRAGAAVTRLEIAPDMSHVTVESTLWIRGPRGWVAWGSRNATVRPEDVEAGVEQQVAGDPQVQAAFDVAEKLGLGAIAGDLKQRALKIGAATSKALGTVRGAFNQELDALALPVLERAPEAARKPEPAPAASDPSKGAEPSRDRSATPRSGADGRR